MRMKLAILCLLLLPISLSLSSCAALGGLASAITPTASKVLDTAVAIATTYELTRDPLTTHVKAVAIKAIATQVAADSSNPAVTIAELESTLNARLLKLAPNPIIAVSLQDLIGGLKGALNIQIAKTAGPTAGAVTQGTLVAINGIAKEVIVVCEFYGA